MVADAARAGSAAGAGVVEAGAAAVAGAAGPAAGGAGVLGAARQTSGPTDPPPAGTRGGAQSRPAGRRPRPQPTGDVWLRPYCPQADQLPLLATIREPVETANGLADAAPGNGSPAAPLAPEAGASPPESLWSTDRIGATLGAFGKELRELFRVRRVDSPDAVLVAPQQAYFLRQNLRLMLLNARLALLSRNGDAYRADLERARRWIDSYYDGEHRNVIAVQNQLRQMLDAKLVLEPPRIDDSLAAVRKARAAVR